MKISEDIRPVTFLKAQAAQLLEQLNETRRPVVITQNGEPRAVMQDPETFQQTQEALAMLKLLAQGEDDVRAGRTQPQDAVFQKLRGTLKP